MSDSSSERRRFQRIEFDARSVASDPARSEKKMSATDWIEAITHFRRDVNDRVAESAKPIINGRSIIELAKKEYELPTPNAGEDHGDFMTPRKSKIRHR